MTRHTVRFIDGRIGRWFRKRGWAGVTLPVPFWGALVVIWTVNHDWSLSELRHEVMGHVPQIERMGTLRYLVTILWQYATVGHRDAPLEIEARQLAGEE